MGIAIAELMIGIVQLMCVGWLWRCWRDLRAEIRRARRIVRDASELLREPEPEPEAPGRHAAPAKQGRHAASPPVDQESYASPNGFWPHPSA